MITALALLFLIVGTFLAAWGALYFKKGSTDNTTGRMFSYLTLLKGLSLYGLSGIFYLSALHMEELSVVYPFVSLTYVWAVVFSRAYLNERINRYKILGLTLIIIGIVCIGVAS
jgi:uncharacterized membrane protein